MKISGKLRESLLDYLTPKVVLLDANKNEVSPRMEIIPGGEIVFPPAERNVVVTGFRIIEDGEATDYPIATEAPNKMTILYE